ncbi:hypothetical protein ACVOMV_33915 [Mesorhizobium atlanticum]
MTILTTRQVGHVDSSAAIKVQPARAISNPGTEYALGKTLLAAKRDFDCVVGFNKMASTGRLLCGRPALFCLEARLVAAVFAPLHSPAEARDR